MTKDAKNGRTIWPRPGLVGRGVVLWLLVALGALLLADDKVGDAVMGMIGDWLSVIGPQAVSSPGGERPSWDR